MDDTEGNCNTLPNHYAKYNNSFINISRILDLLQDTKYYIVQNKEGTRKVKRKVLHYNLDTVFNIAIRGQYFEEFNNLINFAQTNGTQIWRNIKKLFRRNCLYL